MSTTPMTSTQPYLIRALYDWILDNGLTPYILVNADVDGTEVPRQYVKDGRIVLSLSPTAVQALVMGNDTLHFRARFAGHAMEVLVPVQAVMAMYAKENGQGMSFLNEAHGNEMHGDDRSRSMTEIDTSTAPQDPPPLQPRPSGRPTLTVVK
ncbi:Stringent starvation protein B [Gammaproteobacteria bacterium]